MYFVSTCFCNCPIFWIAKNYEMGSCFNYLTFMEVILFQVISVKRISQLGDIPM